MKKTLTILGFLMFFTAFLSPMVSRTVLGADNGNGDATLDGGSEGENDPCNTKDTESYSGAANCVPFSTARIFSKLKLPILNDKDWSDVFGSDDPEVAGQNMYEKIYDLTINQPEQQAAKNITGKYGVTEAEMTQILYGNFSSILKRKPSFTQEEAMNKMAEIQQRFQEEKDLLTVQADIDAAVQPSEFFSNGDVSDSGFDLVNDLSLIEKILFLKSEPISVGGAFDSGAAANPDEGSDKSPSAKNDNSQPEKTGENAQGAKPKNNIGTPGSKGTVTPSPATNPNICFSENDLAQALHQYDQDHPNETAAKTKSASTSGQSSDGEKTGEAAGALGDLTAKEPSTTPVKAALAGEWLKNPPCTEVFCLSVNFVKKPVALYQDSDNCIACHLEKVNAKLKETVSHSLIPGKATGNLLEPNICKKAAFTAVSDLGLNFYAIARPVMTPTNDDLIYGAGIDEEWQSFLSTYKPFPFYEKNPPKANDPEANLIPPTEIDRATKAALSTAGPDTSFEQINKTIQRELATNAQIRAQEIAIAEPAIQSDNDSAYYQAIRREVEQMNYYFDTFKNILHSLHEDVEEIPGPHACTVLKDKKQCE